MHPYNIFITITAVGLFIALLIETTLRRSTLNLAQDAAQKLKETKASLALLRADYDEVDGYRGRAMDRCTHLLKENGSLTEERNKLQRELTLAESAITGHVSDSELLDERYKQLREKLTAEMEHKCKLEEEVKTLRLNEREAIGALGRAKIASQEALANKQHTHNGEMDRLRIRLLDLVQAQCRRRGLLFSEDCARVTDPWHALEWLEFAAKDS